LGSGKGLAATDRVAETRRARVLLIDDDDMLRAALRRLIGPEHEIVDVPGGAEALRLLATDRHFDAIFCDLAMPGVDGAKVYAALLERAPHLARRTALLTGGAYTREAMAFIAQVDAIVLPKPIARTTLLDAIARFAAVVD
jgi:CheY-like chemotaxis protein